MFSRTELEVKHRRCAMEAGAEMDVVRALWLFSRNGFRVKESGVRVRSRDGCCGSVPDGQDWVVDRMQV